MSQASEHAIRVRVDPTNPGQFFACCGLLELADRLWSGAEGWFSLDGSSFCIHPLSAGSYRAADIIREVTLARLAGELAPPLREERDALETKKRHLKRDQKTLGPVEEARRQELGTLSRAGCIRIGEPFGLRLDWWQKNGDDVPKTWAGSQEVLRIAQAALASCEEAFASADPFGYRCVLRPCSEESETDLPSKSKDGRTDGDKVEPFYFDSGRGVNAHPLDVGFSPNKLKGLTTSASPAIEFLCLVGLQRCRPLLSKERRVFNYYTWTVPLDARVANVAGAGLLAHVDGRGFRFEIAFRTDQRKHKAFTSATQFVRR